MPGIAAPAVYVIPKQHATLSELSQAAQQRLFATASMLSSAIFDTMQVHGTNIVLSDEEHAYALVVGRTEEDGLEMRWKPNRASPQDLTDTARRISDETWYIGKEEKKPEPPKAPPAIEAPTGAKKKIETRNDPFAADRSSKRRVGYEDPDPEVDSPDEVARDIQVQVRKGPTEEKNYMIRHLTRRR